MIRKSNDSKALSLQPLRTLGITYLLGIQSMVSAIQLYCQLVRQADEVGYVIANDMLPLKPYSQTISFQVLPKQCFCFRRMVSVLPRKILQQFILPRISSLVVIPHRC